MIGAPAYLRTNNLASFLDGNFPKGQAAPNSWLEDFFKASAAPPQAFAQEVIALSVVHEKAIVILWFVR